MKAFIALLLLLPSWASAQTLFTPFPTFVPVTEEVVEIHERTFRRGFWPSGWKHRYLYENGRLIRQTNHFRGELRMDETYEYTESPGRVAIKHFNTEKTAHFLTVHHFDPAGALTKTEAFAYPDTQTLTWLCHGFEYDSLNEGVEFQRTSFYPDSGKGQVCYALSFKDGHLVERLTRDACTTLSKREEMEYLNPRTARLTIDLMDPAATVTGARSENGMQRYLYQLDQQGNWVKRYYLSSKGRKILEIKRQISYQKPAKN